ncbi:hypothetical protein L195_g019904, partial [Trifolium pratense]
VAVVALSVLEGCEASGGCRIHCIRVGDPCFCMTMPGLLPPSDDGVLPEGVGREDAEDFVEYVGE